MQKSVERKTNLAALGYTLLGLGIVYGITAVIGAVISHSSYKKCRDPLQRSHLRLQLIVFWILLALISITLLSWPGVFARTMLILSAVLWLSTLLVGTTLLLQRRFVHPPLVLRSSRSTTAPKG